MRKSPIRHHVHKFQKDNGTVVNDYARGKGTAHLANPNLKPTLSRRDFSWNYYKVDYSRDGYIGVEGKAIERLTDGENQGVLVETALYYEGDSFVRIFDRSFYVRLTYNRQTEESPSIRHLLVRDEKTDKEWLLPWNDTMKRRYGRVGEKRFNKKNVVADIMNKVLIPAKISGKFKFIEHNPDKTELER
jgi:hypothetical protein